MRRRYRKIWPSRPDTRRRTRRFEKSQLTIVPADLQSASYRPGRVTWPIHHIKPPSTTRSKVDPTPRHLKPDHVSTSWRQGSAIHKTNMNVVAVAVRKLSTAVAFRYLSIPPSVHSNCHARATSPTKCQRIPLRQLSISNRSWAGLQSHLYIGAGIVIIHCKLPKRLLRVCRSQPLSAQPVWYNRWSRRLDVGRSPTLAYCRQTARHVFGKMDVAPHAMNPVIWKLCPSTKLPEFRQKRHYPRSTPYGIGFPSHFCTGTHRCREIWWVMFVLAMKSPIDELRGINPKPPSTKWLAFRRPALASHRYAGAIEIRLREEYFKKTFLSSWPDRG